MCSNRCLIYQVPRQHNTHMKYISYAEYRTRMKNISTADEASAFAKEIMAPVMDTIDPKPQVEKVTGTIEKPQVPHIHRYAPIAPKIDKMNLSHSAWYDVVASETEARVIALYSKGLTTGDIASYMKTMHGIDMSQPSVSGITDKVYPLVKEWQTRTLASCYPVIYLDGLHFKVRDSGKIASKVAYIALGVNQYGQKEVLGIYTADSEGAKFWMGVLNDLKNRGVEDIIFACVDGLKGFPDAVKVMYPLSIVQVCIVHQIRHTVMFIPHKDREQFCLDLKNVYTAPSEEAGFQALKDLMERWPQYRPYLKSWEDRWADLAPFFSYPQPIRRMIYTTNTIENLNRQFRKVTKTTTIFPHDDSLLKLLWLAQTDIMKNKTMQIRNWSEILAQLVILFPDRVHF